MFIKLAAFFIAMLSRCVALCKHRALYVVPATFPTQIPALLITRNRRSTNRAFLDLTFSNKFLLIKNESIEVRAVLMWKIWHYRGVIIEDYDGNDTLWILQRSWFEQDDTTGEICINSMKWNQFLKLTAVGILQYFVSFKN